MVLQIEMDNTNVKSDQQYLEQRNIQKNESQ